MTSFKVEKEIKISSTSQQVWSVLTDPSHIKEYLFGTEAISEWKEGSDLVFQGVYDGHSYKDKGVILKWQPYQLFQYTYLAQFSGLDDQPKNYHIVTYNLTEVNGFTILKLTQENIHNEQAMKHSDSGWDSILQSIKSIAEKS